MAFAGILAHHVEVQRVFAAAVVCDAFRVVRLRHGDVTRGTHHGFAIEGEAIAHDVFGIVGIFSSVAIVVSIVRIAGFAVIGCRARIAIRHSIRAIFAGMVVSIAVLSRCSTICRYVSVLSRRLPNRLPFLLLLLIRLFRLIARLPLFRHRLRRLRRLPWCRPASQS